MGFKQTPSSIRSTINENEDLELTRKIRRTTENEQHLSPRFGIFVDANVLFATYSKRHNDEFSMMKTEFEVLRLVSAAGNGRLLTSEITRIEAAKNLAEDDCREIERIDSSRFRKLVDEMTHTQIPKVNMRELYQNAYEKHRRDIDAATSGGYWECLEISNINVMDIFSQYGQKQGIFADRTKKHQFADAIVFEQVRAKATPDMPVFIYSKDKDFETVGKEAENIEWVRSLPDLFSLLRMEDDVSEARGMINGLSTLISKDIREKVDRFCHCEVTAGEITPRKLGCIHAIRAEQVASVRYENRVGVLGRVIIEAELSRKCLSARCPIAHSRGWKLGGRTHAVETTGVADAVFEVGATALMHIVDYEAIEGDKEDGSLSGTLILRNEAGMYWIMETEWDGKGRSEESPISGR